MSQAASQKTTIGPFDYDRSGFAAHIARLQAIKKKRIAAVGDITNGAILRKRTAERWAFLLPDMTEPGKWRLQYFDAQGFSGHGIYATAAELVAAAVAEDFEMRDDDALDRVQNLHSFVRGNFASDLIRRVGQGDLAYRAADALLAQYDAENTALAA